VKGSGFHRDSDSQEPTLSDTREGAGDRWGIPKRDGFVGGSVENDTEALLRDGSGRLARGLLFVATCKMSIA